MIRALDVSCHRCQESVESQVLPPEFPCTLAHLWYREFPSRSSLMTRRSPTCALALLLSSCLAGLSSASDWPQWRGPHPDGVSEETGLLASWEKDGPPLTWKA